MSTVVKVSLKTSSLAVGIGLACVAKGVQELNYICEKEKELVDCDKNIKKVDLLIKTIDGKEIGVIQKDDGIEFIAKDLECALTQDAIKKIRQRFSKYLVLHELKNKGYEKIKEERLPNGKIRMVVEKWE